MTDRTISPAEFASKFESLRVEIGRVIVGQDSVVEQVLVSLFAAGHILVEGLPGLGKTRLVSTLAGALDLDFRRIQFTPDLMPSDISGADILIRGESGTKVEFQPGPVFCNILLADEINRAAPRTQSALLEVMQERTVTVGGSTRALPAPFFVMATQNPIELEGTYPLPEAQLDRFLMKILVRAEGVDAVIGILERFSGSTEPQATKVLDRTAVSDCIAVVREVVLPSTVASFIARIIASGSPNEASAPEIVRKYVKYGPSPRAALGLAMAAKSLALSKGRPQVDFADVRTLAPAVLRHRIILNFDGEASRVDIHEIIERMLNAANRS